MYNSKDLITDEELTFLSYNQTVNVEFRLDEVLTSDLWVTGTDNGLVRAVPLFNCDAIVSSNPSDRVLDTNKCIICENVADTLITCTSADTGFIHYYTVELYAFTPYSVLDVVDELTVYCLVYDEYMNTLGNVSVEVYVDSEQVDTVVTDNNGVARYRVDQDCTVKFLYGETESNTVTITGGD